MIKNGALVPAEIYTDLRGLSGLKRAARDKDPEALKKVAQQFESLFMQMMLKSMRQANLAEGIFDNEQTRFYRDLFDQQLSLSLGRRGGLGLTDLLMRQLGGRPAPAAGASEASPAAPLRRAPAGAASPRAFVDRLWPHAREAAAELGVDPRVLIAQAALETGWGRSVIGREDGRSSHNFFGIKAGAGWQGDRVFRSTLEVDATGVARRERAAFRVYDSPAESFRDYVAFLKGNPRYGQALARAGDPVAFVRGLQQAGYATDPRYADKILDILQREVVAGAPQRLKDRA